MPKTIWAGMLPSAEHSMHLVSVHFCGFAAGGLLHAMTSESFATQN